MEITHTRQSVSGTAARTFGEAVQARLGVANTVQRPIDVAVALTLIAAAVLVVLATLPLLGRITALDQVRFE